MATVTHTPPKTLEGTTSPALNPQAKEGEDVRMEKGQEESTECLVQPQVSFSEPQNILVDPPHPDCDATPIIICNTEEPGEDGEVQPPPKKKKRKITERGRERKRRLSQARWLRKEAERRREIEELEEKARQQKKIEEIEEKARQQRMEEERIREVIEREERARPPLKCSGELRRRRQAMETKENADRMLSGTVDLSSSDVYSFRGEEAKDRSVSPPIAWEWWRR